MDETKKEEFEEKLDAIKKDDVDDLAKTAGILASWMSDQRYTVAEQLVILELVRTTVTTGLMTALMRKEIEKPRAKPRQPAVAGMFGGVQN